MGIGVKQVEIKICKKVAGFSLGFKYRYYIAHMIIKRIFICVRGAVRNPNDDIIGTLENILINFTKQWLHSWRCELEVTMFLIFNPVFDE